MPTMRAKTHVERSLLAGALLALAACGNSGMSPEQARKSAVAEAGGGRLSGAVLERWLAGSKVMPDRAGANVLLSAWLDDAALIDAVRHDAPLDDQATFDVVFREPSKRIMAGKFFAARDSLLPPITERQVDSVLDIDHVRVFQEIVVRVKPPVDTTAIRAAAARARAIRDKILGGADFTAVMKASSDDSASKAHDGYLPALTADQLPGRLAQVFDMPPNTISPIIPAQRTAELYIVRRATRQESRPGIREWLAPHLARRADSLFSDSVARTRKITIAGDAIARTRAMGAEPVVAAPGGPLATWKGGELTAAQVRSATLLLTPADRAGLSNAPDTAIKQYLMMLSRREAILPAMVQEPLPTPAIRTTFFPAYRHLVDTLRAAVQRLPATLSPADAATQQIDSVLAGRARFLALPGSLAEVVRSRGPITVHQDVLDGVVKGAIALWQVAHRNDTLPPTGQPSPTLPTPTAPAITPATGGAPKP